MAETKIKCKAILELGKTKKKNIYIYKSPIPNWYGWNGS